MLRFAVTPRLREAASRYCTCCSDDDAGALRKYSRDDTGEISLEHVELLSRALRRLPAPHEADDLPVWVRAAPMSWSFVDARPRLSNRPRRASGAPAAARCRARPPGVQA